MIKKFYLVAYRSRLKNEESIFANDVVENSLADWLIERVEKYPDDKTVLLWAREIDDMEYHKLKGLFQ